MREQPELGGGGAGLEPGEDQLRVSNTALEVFEMNIMGPEQTLWVKSVKVPPGLSADDGLLCSKFMSSYFRGAQCL